MITQTYEYALAYVYIYIHTYIHTVGYSTESHFIPNFTLLKRLHMSE